MNKNKIDIKFLILLIIVFALVIINLIIYLKNTIIPKQETPLSVPIVVTSEQDDTKVITINTEEELIKYLSTLGERDRMQYYCGTFFKYLKRADYTSAYNLLYDEFKQKYFPTIDDFEQYVKKYYPRYIGLDYDDITRQGDLYVLRLKIINVLGNSNDEDPENSEDSENLEDYFQRVVIKENYYNDFELSFQVMND